MLPEIRNNTTRMRIIQLFLFLFFTLNSFAQDCKIDGAEVMEDKPLIRKRTILDTATVKVLYELQYREDSTKAEKTKAQTILLCGDTHCMFLDYYTILADSMAYAMEKQKASPSEFMGKIHNLHKKRKFKIEILTDFAKDITSVCEEAIETYAYTEPAASFSWNLAEGDTTLLGYKCSKATCTFRGRNYIAWYAQDINIPLGPYRFGALPGIIMLMYDTKDNYIFTLNGLETNPTTNNLIYQKEEGSLFHKGEKEKMRAIIKKENEHWTESILSSPIIRIDPEVAAKMDRTPDPYNPIELE